MVGSTVTKCCFFYSELFLLFQNTGPHRWLYIRPCLMWIFALTAPCPQYRIGEGSKTVDTFILRVQPSLSPCGCSLCTTELCSLSHVTCLNPFWLVVGVTSSLGWKLYDWGLVSCTMPWESLSRTRWWGMLFWKVSQVDFFSLDLFILLCAYGCFGYMYES